MRITHQAVIAPRSARGGDREVGDADGQLHESSNRAYCFFETTSSSFFVCFVVFVELRVFAVGACIVRVAGALLSKWRIANEELRGLWQDAVLAT